MKKLTRTEIKEVFDQWNQAWNRHDLDGVVALFHEEVLFENFTGAYVRGKEALREAWRPWFNNHGNFHFTEEDIFVDEVEQKVLFRWTLRWPSLEKGHEGRSETRRGVDVVHFKDGKIIKKLTYSKTTLEIDGKRCRMSVSTDTP
jgi:uncharacterized protein (TIGR02246 family)